MSTSFFESQRKNIESALRQLLNSDLPQVTPFLNAIGIRSNDSLPIPQLNYEGKSSIWYWFGVWDPFLQIIGDIAINDRLKQILFKKIFYKISFLRNRYNNKYEMMQSIDKSYGFIAWFIRHLLIAKFVFKMKLSSKEIFTTQFLSTFYYRFFGYFSSSWFQLLFDIDIYAPTVPLFLDNLQNDMSTVKRIQKCAHLSMYIYGPQDFMIAAIRTLRWMILPESMSNSLKQYSYSKYNQFITKKLEKNGFILKTLSVSDSHSQNFELNGDIEESELITNEIDKEFGGSSVLSYMIVIEKATNYLYVVFRGTELLTDFYHDMFFSDVQSTHSKISVHAGYYAALFGVGSSNILSIEEEINKILMENPTITQVYFTGHSMVCVL